MVKSISTYLQNPVDRSSSISIATNSREQTKDTTSPRLSMSSGQSQSEGGFLPRSRSASAELKRKEDEGKQREAAAAAMSLQSDSETESKKRKASDDAGDPTIMKKLKVAAALLAKKSTAPFWTTCPFEVVAAYCWEKLGDVVEEEDEVEARRKLADVAAPSKQEAELCVKRFEQEMLRYLEDSNSSEAKKESKASPANLFGTKTRAATPSLASSNGSEAASSASKMKGVLRFPLPGKTKTTSANQDDQEEKESST